MTLPKLPKLNINGDTIVEVLISMAILSLVLGTAYVTSNRSLQLSTEAGNRNQALGYAQKQIEFIKNAALKADPADFNSYKAIGEDFCIYQDGSAHKVSSGECSSADQFGQYAMAVKYNDANQLFTVQPTWPGSTGTEQQLTLYYRPVGIFQALKVETKPHTAGFTQNGESFETQIDGKLNPGGVPVTRCYFQVETEADYGGSWDNRGDSYKEWDCPNGQNDKDWHEVFTIARELKQLHTKYFFRICATNGRGTVCGANFDFTTPVQFGPSVVLCLAEEPSCLHTSTTIPRGKIVKLHWNVSNSDSCAASNTASDSRWSGDKDHTPGWHETITPNGDVKPNAVGTFTYSIICKRTGSPDTPPSTVQITVESSTPTVNLCIDEYRDEGCTKNKQVNNGDSVSLSWKSTNADSCLAGNSGDLGTWTGSREIGGPHSQPPGPPNNPVGPITFNTTLNLLCTNPDTGETGVSSVNVTVPGGGGGGGNCSINTWTGPYQVDANTDFGVGSVYSHCTSGCRGEGNLSGSVPWYGPNRQDGSDNLVPFSGTIRSGSSEGWGNFACYGTGSDKRDIHTNTPPPPPPPTSYQCSDLNDNDSDYLVDMSDPGCSSPSDNDEYNPPASECADGWDNDGDLWTDGGDPGCSSPPDEAPFNPYPGCPPRC